MELFVAALEAGGPWALVVLLLYLMWDREKRQETGIREAIKDQSVILQILAQSLNAVSTCVSENGDRLELIEREILRQTPAESRRKT